MQTSVAILDLYFGTQTTVGTQTQIWSLVAARSGYHIVPGGSACQSDLEYPSGLMAFEYQHGPRPWKFMWIFMITRDPNINTDPDYIKAMDLDIALSWNSGLDVRIMLGSSTGHTDLPGPGFIMALGQKHGLNCLI